MPVDFCRHLVGIKTLGEMSVAVTTFVGKSVIIRTFS